MKFIIILLIVSIAIISIVNILIKLINKNLTKKRYRLTTKFIFLFTYIIILLLAVIAGRKFMFNLF